MLRSFYYLTILTNLVPAFYTPEGVPEGILGYWTSRVLVWLLVTNVVLLGCLYSEFSHIGSCLGSFCEGAV